MLPKEIIKNIKRIHIKTNHLANEIFAGEYESAFRGRGMEFEEVREYQAGDEVRTIDWNVTARMGRPFVKVYREEREMTVMLMVDMSSSLNFGSGEKLKLKTGAEIAAVLAYAAIKSNDKVGLMMFTDRVEKFIPPKKGKGHVFRVIQEILTFKPSHKKTSLTVSLEYLMKVIRRRAIVFLISDFLDQDYETAMRIARKRHDLLCLQLYDPAEINFPSMGWVKMRDPETGQSSWVNTSSKHFQGNYHMEAENSLKLTQKNIRSLGIDLISLNQQKDYIYPLLQFFRFREKRQ